jgi:hypothetical protein
LIEGGVSRRVSSLPEPPERRCYGPSAGVCHPSASSNNYVAPCRFIEDGSSADRFGFFGLKKPRKAARSAWIVEPCPEPSTASPAARSFAWRSGSCTGPGLPPHLPAADPPTDFGAAFCSRQRVATRYFDLFNLERASALSAATARREGVRSDPARSISCTARTLTRWGVALAASSFRRCSGGPARPYRLR